MSADERDNECVKVAAKHIKRMSAVLCISLSEVTVPTAVNATAGCPVAITRSYTQLNIMRGVLQSNT